MAKRPTWKIIVVSPELHFTLTKAKAEAKLKSYDATIKQLLKI